MGWAAIIGAILSFLGPLFSEWLKTCAEKRAKRAAGAMPAPDTFASDGEAIDALFAEMSARLPRHAKVRRGLLERSRVACKSAGLTSAGPARPLSQADADALRAGAAGVRRTAADAE